MTDIDWPVDYGNWSGYLDTASSGLHSRAVRDRLVAVVGQRFDGTPPDYEATIDSCRAKYARLTGVPADAVSIGSQTSVTTSLVAANVNRLGAGDEVLCVYQDFGSVVFPFTSHADTGRFVVRHVPLDDLAGEISSRTALVAFSLVQSKDGVVADVDAIAAAAAAAGAWTMVDVTQAAGWMPMGPGQDFDPNLFDVTVGAAYKWLCTPRGVTLNTFSPRAIDTMRPFHTSWYAGKDLSSSGYGPDIDLAEGARRFDVSPVWPQYTALDVALDVFTPARVEAISRHDLALAAAFCTAVGAPSPRSPIVSLPDPEDAIAGAAAAAGVTMSSRLGKARFSFHLYNTMADVDRAVDAVGRARRAKVVSGHG